MAKPQRGMRTATKKKEEKTFKALRRRKIMEIILVISYIWGGGSKRMRTATMKKEEKSFKSLRRRKIMEIILVINYIRGGGSILCFNAVQWRGIGVGSFSSTFHLKSFFSPINKFSGQARRLTPSPPPYPSPPDDQPISNLLQEGHYYRSNLLSTQASTLWVKLAA